MAQPNPFMGDDSSDSHLPIELQGFEFDTFVYPSKPKKNVKTIPRTSAAIIIPDNLPPNDILVPIDIEAGYSYDDFKQEWQTHQTKEKIEKVIEKTTDVISVPKAVKTAYIKDLDKNSQDFIKFLVSDLSPMANAFETALDQTEQILKLITNSEQEMGQAGTIRAMLRDAMNMKALAFISGKLKLDKNQVDILVSRYFKPRDIVMPPMARQPVQPQQTNNPQPPAPKGPPKRG